MDIEAHISKLSIEYMKRLENCQLLLRRAEIENRRLRRDGASLSDRHDVTVEMSVLHAKIVAYTQAKVDINSILQELGT